MKNFLFAIVLFFSFSAQAYQAQVFLDLHSQKQHDWFGDDEIYVVSSVAESNGDFGSTLSWAGNMRSSGSKQNIARIPIWMGEVRPGEGVAINIHVFEQNSSNYNSGLGFGQEFAREAVSLITRVPFGADLSQFFSALNAPLLSDRIFRMFIKGRPDSYLGTLTTMLGTVRGTGIPNGFTYPSYRSSWIGDHALLTGDGAIYHAWVRTVIR